MNNRKKTFRSVALSVGCLLLLMIFQPQMQNVRARRLMQLPKEATVVRVEFGDWSGDGKVSFRLPKDRPVSEWLDNIWKLNPPEKSIGAGDPNPNMDQNISSENERRAMLAGASQSIEYEKESGLYVFDIMLEK